MVVELTGRSTIRVAAFAACLRPLRRHRRPIGGVDPGRAPGDRSLVALHGIGRCRRPPEPRAVGTVAPARARAGGHRLQAPKRVPAAAAGAAGERPSRPRRGAHPKASSPPTPPVCGACAHYLAGRGLTVTAHTDMTLTVAGTPPPPSTHSGSGCASSAARRAARFTHRRARSGCRPAIAGAVRPWAGSTRPCACGRRRGARSCTRSRPAITPTCPGATSAQHALGGYLPADLGDSRGRTARTA